MEFKAKIYKPKNNSKILLIFKNFLKMRLNKGFIKVSTYFSLDLNDDLLNWAKTDIPNMNTPTAIFVPMVKWLKDTYGIEFADKLL